MKKTLVIFLVMVNLTYVASSQYINNEENLMNPYDSIKLKYASYTISPAVIKIYKNADIDGDHKLSWYEIEQFQRFMTKKFVYRHNPTALTPDEFLQQGGGDCEDWAIFTCKMLHYYGRTAYIGCFGKVTRNKHALCLLKVNGKIPSEYMWLEISGWGIPEGNYIPIDYESVGSLQAIDRRWKLARIQTPEEMYGLQN